MKKVVATMVLAACCGAAGAQEISDGVKAWERQDYARAHGIFTRLALAGNTEAQRQLGEMIGFGEGAPEDVAEARGWLERSRAGGNRHASESLALVERRAAGKAEIRRHVSSYDGTGLALLAYQCGTPAIPESSKTKREIEDVHARIGDWYACYGRFTQTLAAAASNAIPKPVAEIMNTAELAGAQARANSALSRIGADGKREAEQVAAAESKWVAATERKVAALEQMSRMAIEQDRTFERVVLFGAETSGHSAKR